MSDAMVQVIGEREYLCDVCGRVYDLPFPDGTCRWKVWHGYVARSKIRTKEPT